MPHLPVDVQALGVDFLAFSAHKTYGPMGLGFLVGTPDILDRLEPMRIVVVSSSPQIRFPDCYGIDMSKMKEFVAFRALVELLKDNKKKHLLKETYQRCKAQEGLPKEQIKNEVAALYDEYPYEVVSRKIAEIVTPPKIKPEIDLFMRPEIGLQRRKDIDDCRYHDGKN